MTGPMPDEIRDELKPKAIELRRQGWTYREIAGSLNISISTCSLWLRDVPAPPCPGYAQERVANAWRGRWEPYHRAAEEARRRTKLAARAEVGELTDREVLILGALVYWCEGTKDKIYRRTEAVKFINSDPALVTFFIRFLEVAGVPRRNINFRVSIHETADIEEATRFWASLVDAPVDVFQKPIIKRHNPRTTRKNLLDEYRGCLMVSVLQSAELYRRIEGWAYGAMLAPEVADERLISRSDRALEKLVQERGRRSRGR